jgi:Rieske Fe-S protein
VAVVAEQQDGFIRRPAEPIGRVWLVRSGADSTASIRCFQSICPHLGCGVEYAPDRAAFVCPCHASEFAIDGRQRFGPSPRDLDELVCRVTDPDEAGVRWIEVRYQEFRTGTPDRRPV